MKLERRPLEKKSIFLQNHKIVHLQFGNIWKRLEFVKDKR